ncbi:OmpH family outer membrane protein [Stieleria sp. TO1_6]|uniref:OmpH family outer membrane protein n=1 Tax=Stieleria tagensis TaxID=2956795 RepID=UPI00209A71AB|nr:OmpH family outer membrane protein [Stieleria tagensis]MCO8120702.1 OmpH family outer membrane protein [Stieleria tagensis]
MRTVRHQICGIAIGLASMLGAGLSTGTVSAQDTAPHRVAVVDVASIFKNHEGIKLQVAKVEADLKAYDGELKEKREMLKTTAAKLKQLTPGSPEYSALEEQFAEMDSKLRLDMARKRKELADAEARIYFDNYQKISEGVKLIAKHNKINLVLRYNSEEMDQTQGESVIRGVMKNIVYHDDALNMTPTVMTYLNNVFKNEIAQAGAAAPRR